MQNEKPLFINIKVITVAKIILVFVLFYFLYLVKDILAILFVSLILASAVDPWVDWMHNKRIPRGVGIFLIYFVIFGVLSTAVYLIIPPIVTEVSDLVDSYPVAERLFSNYDTLKEYSYQNGLIDNLKTYVRDNFESIGTNIQDLASGLFSKIAGVFGGFFTFFLVLVITFYMVVEEKAIKKIVWSIVPDKHRIYTMNLMNRIQQKIGLWLRGQLILSVVIFALTYFGLLMLGIFTEPVKYALVLALIAGLTEFVPYLGPILAAIPAVFLAFTQSYILGVSVAVLYYVIQLVENNIIVPNLMRKVVGLNPIVSIAVLLIGFRIAGVPGAILSIPVTTAINVFINDLFSIKEEEESREHLAAKS